MPSTNNHPTYFTRRANNRVPNMAFSSEVDITGAVRAELGIPATAVDNAIMNAIDTTAGITRGGTVATTFNPDTMMGPYGRNVTVKSSTGTPSITVRGRDYLGQPIAETIVSGAAAVAGKKAFKFVDNVTAGAAAATLSVGFGNVLGLPYAMIKVDAELTDGAIGSAGTFVAAATTAQTATTADPRGSIVPAAAPNGAREYVVIGQVMNGQLHGVPHFTS